jgi:hypothetical protein
MCVHKEGVREGEWERDTERQGEGERQKEGGRAKERMRAQRYQPAGYMYMCSLMCWVRTETTSAFMQRPARIRRLPIVRTCHPACCSLVLCDCIPTSYYAILIVMASCFLNKVFFVINVQFACSTRVHTHKAGFSKYCQKFAHLACRYSR